MKMLKPMFSTEGMKPLRAGDVVCVTDIAPDDFFSKMLGNIIIGVTKLRSADGDSEFRHSALITSMVGDTFEALTKFTRNNIYTKYNGYRVIIGRHKDMTPEGFEYAHKILSDKYEGKTYPYFRLLAQLTSVTAKWFPMTKPVCSELTRMHGLLAGCRDYEDEVFPKFDNMEDHFDWAHKKSKSYTPDNQADEIRGADLWEVIYYGDFNV